MKNLIYLTIITFIIWSCENASTSSSKKQQLVLADETKANVQQSQEPISPNKLLILPDAVKILGEPAHLSDSTTKISADLLTYHCAYTADSIDKSTEKTGTVYFLFENYNQLASAQKKYTFIKTANEDHGIKVLDDLGDEAYFHTDGNNFYFIIVRKGNKVFNMKVNKITSKTSLEEFNMIAKKITDSL